MKMQLFVKKSGSNKNRKTSGTHISMRRLFIGMMIMLVLVIGSAFYYSPKTPPHSVLSMVFKKIRIERIVKILRRLENSQDSQQLQGAIDRLLADYLIAVEEHEAEEFDRKAKRRTIPRSTTVD
jgi:hypothetical protein